MGNIGRSIASKLLAAVALGIGSLLLLGLLVSWASWSSLQWFEQEFDARDTVSPLLLKMDRDFRGQVQNWKDLLLRGNDPVAREVYWGEFLKLEGRTEAEAAALEQVDADAEVRDLVGQFVRAHLAAGARYRAGLAVFEQHNFDPAAADALVKGVDRVPADLLNRAAGAASAKSRRSFDLAVSRVQRRVFLGLVAILLCAASSIAAVAWGIRVWVQRPAQRLIRELDRLAAGNFSAQRGAVSPDEIGQISLRVELIRRALEQALDQPQQGSGALGSR